MPVINPTFPRPARQPSGQHWGRTAPCPVPRMSVQAFQDAPRGLLRGLLQPEEHPSAPLAPAALLPAVDPAFGVEIETMLPYTRGSDVLACAGVPLQQHTEPAYSGWHVDCDNGAEFVSRILQTDELHEVHDVVNTARAFGATTHPSMCGVHIHMNAQALSIDTLLHLICLFHAHEPQLYRLLQVNAERRRHWCRPTDEAFLQRLAAAKPHDAEGIVAVWGKDSRNRGLNLRSLDKHGTLEFRLFNGSLDGARIESYVRLTHVLIRAAQANGPFTQWHKFAEPQHADIDLAAWLIHFGLGVVSMPREVPVAPRFVGAGTHCLVPRARAAPPSLTPQVGADRRLQRGVPTPIAHRQAA